MTRKTGNLIDYYSSSDAALMRLSADMESTSWTTAYKMAVAIWLMGITTAEDAETQWNAWCENNPDMGWP